MTSIQGAGHVRPLLPFADAFRDQGHDVLVGTPRGATGLVLDAGHAAWALPEAPREAADAVFARARGLPRDEANRVILGGVFAGVYARAALPGAQAAVEEWRPDVLLRESCEFAGAVAAERAGVPRARVAPHMERIERYIVALAAPEVGALRAELGLAPDPSGERLLAEASMTLTPPALDGHRREGHYREPSVAAPPPAADEDGRPLVYLSLGTAVPQGDAYPRLYRAAVDQLARLDVRVLLNTGRRDPAALGPLPAGVVAEPWVDERAVLGRVAAMVSHGGAGSVRTALSAGVPLALLPIAGDQPRNATAVAEAGAGVLAAGPGELHAALASVLDDGRHAAAAREIAAEVATLPLPEAAIEVVEAAAAGRVAPISA